MKKTSNLLAATAVAALMSGTAFAADYSRSPVPAPVYSGANWDGMYAGIHLGVATQQSVCEPTNNGNDPVNCAGYGFAYYGSAEHIADDHSMIFGAEIGRNWQTRGFVYGVAADLTLGSLKGTSVGCSGSCSYEAKVNWLASFRGRAGLAIDDTMVYMTGGLAIASIEDTVWAGDADMGKTQTSMPFGWVAGVGVEHRISSTVSITGELLHYAFNPIDIATTDGTYHLTATTDHEFTVARVGMNFRF